MIARAGITVESRVAHFGGDADFLNHSEIWLTELRKNTFFAVSISLYQVAFNLWMAAPHSHIRKARGSARWDALPGMPRRGVRAVLPLALAPLVLLAGCSDLKYGPAPACAEATNATSCESTAPHPAAHVDRTEGPKWPGVKDSFTILDIAYVDCVRHE